MTAAHLVDLPGIQQHGSCLKVGGGTHPKRLRQVLPLVDWVGLDIKATAAA